MFREIPEYSRFSRFVATLYHSSVLWHCWLGDGKWHLACKKYCHNNAQKFTYGAILVWSGSGKLGSEMKTEWVCVCVLVFCAVSKQINDKERVAAALENPYLLSRVNECISDAEYRWRPWRMYILDRIYAVYCTMFGLRQRSQTWLDTWASLGKMCQLADCSYFWKW